MKQEVDSQCTIASKVFNAMMTTITSDPVIPHPHGDVEDFNHLYHGLEFFDDVYASHPPRNEPLQPDGRRYSSSRR